MSVRRAAPAAPAPARRTAEVDALSDAFASCRVATAAAKPLPWSGAVAAALAARGKALATAAKPGKGATTTTTIVTTTTKNAAPTGYPLQLTRQEREKKPYVAYVEQDMNKYDYAMWFHQCCELSMKALLDYANDEAVRDLWHHVNTSGAYESARTFGTKNTDDMLFLVKGNDETIKAYFRRTVDDAKKVRRTFHAALDIAATNHVGVRWEIATLVPGNHDLNAHKTAVTGLLEEWRNSVWLWKDVEFVNALMHAYVVPDKPYLQMEPDLIATALVDRPAEWRLEAIKEANGLMLQKLVMENFDVFDEDVSSLLQGTRTEMLPDTIGFLRHVEFILRFNPNAALNAGPMIYPVMTQNGGIPTSPLLLQLSAMGDLYGTTNKDLSGGHMSLASSILNSLNRAGLVRHPFAVTTNVTRMLMRGQAIYDSLPH